MLDSRLPQLFLVAIIIWSKPAVAEQLPPLVVMGNAYDTRTEELLYREYHYCEEGQSLCTVQYQDSSGDVFASKTLDYRQSSIAPLVEMTDYRRGVEVRIPAAENDGVVVDAGFDNFVRSIWDTLDAGGSKRFRFQVVGFDDPIKMKAQRSNSGDCRMAELCLEIHLASWLLGMVTDPIELFYSRADRRLLRFSGISNIKGEDGQSLNVDIHYQYES